MGTILQISLKMNFAPKTLGCYGLKSTDKRVSIRFNQKIYHLFCLAKISRHVSEMKLDWQQSEHKNGNVSLVSFESF